MKDLPQATLLFLVKDSQILLAMKKRGFGKNLWNGVGGKPEHGETIEQTAIRECREEIGVVPNSLEKVALLDFYFPEASSDWNQQVHVFFCTSWKNEPAETEEMAPAWYELGKIPYEKMWEDDQYWLPLVIDNKFVTAKFWFGEDEKLHKKVIQTKPR